MADTIYQVNTAAVGSGDGSDLANGYTRLSDAFIGVQAVNHTGNVLIFECSGGEDDLDIDFNDFAFSAGGPDKIIVRATAGNEMLVSGHDAGRYFLSNSSDEMFNFRGEEIPVDIVDIQLNGSGINIPFLVTQDAPLNLIRVRADGFSNGPNYIGGAGTHSQVGCIWNGAGTPGSEGVYTQTGFTGTVNISQTLARNYADNYEQDAGTINIDSSVALDNAGEVDFDSISSVTYSASEIAEAGTGNVQAADISGYFVNAAAGDFTLSAAGITALSAKGDAGGTINIGPDQVSGLVNVDPVLDTPHPDVTIPANSTAPLDFGSGFSDDNPGDTLTFSSSPDIGAANGWSWDSATGIATPNGSLTQGAVSYDITASDGNGGTYPVDTVLITITAPAIRIDDITSGPIYAGDPITIDHSYASASGKTYTINGQAVTETSQSATQSVLPCPDPKTFGDKTLSYLTDLTIEITDGGDADTEVFRITPNVGDYYEESLALTGFNGPSYAPGLSVDDNGYCEVLTGNVTVDLVNGITQADEGGTYRLWYQDESDNVWSVPIDRDAPAPAPDDIVTIDSIVPAKTSAVVTFSYSGVVVTGFEYNIGAGWISATSPLTIPGLAAETAYDLDIRPVNYNSSGNETTTSFTTEEAVDTTPNPFSFTPQTSLARSVYATSNAITVLGVDAGVDIPVTVVGGEYSVSTNSGQDWGAWTTLQTNVRLNYQIRTRLQTSIDYDDPVDTDLTVGGVESTFTGTTLADAVPPVISLTGGNQTLVEGTAWVEPGYSAIDNADGDISVSGVVITGAVDVDNVGVYTLTYTATDAAGNVASTTRTVTVTEFVQGDITSPIISLIGGNVVITEGGTYSEPGYSASDDTDGDITDSVVITGSVNTSLAGAYTLTYTATDNANNTGSVTRTVTVLAATQYPIVANAPARRTYIAERFSRVEKGEAVFIKQTDEILDFDFDLTEWLAAENDSLSADNFSIDTGETVEVLGAGLISGTSRIKVWLSGGSAGSNGQAYPVELTIITAGYRKAQFTFRLVVIDR